MSPRQKHSRAAEDDGDNRIVKSVKTRDKDPTHRETQPSRSTSKGIQIIESTGDLFSVEAGNILVHACNCKGTWGAGIAAAFKKHYPAAFQIYHDHCDEHGASLLGTCLLISPQHDSKDRNERDTAHWIGCLFTSVGKGKAVGNKDSILKATDQAVRDLVHQVQEHLDDTGRTEDIRGIKMCKINSGLFKVPWEASREVIEAIEVGNVLAAEIEVITRDVTA